MKSKFILISIIAVPLILFGAFLVNILFFGKSLDELRNAVISNNFKAYQTPSLSFNNVAYAKDLDSKTRVLDSNGNIVGVDINVIKSGNGSKVVVSNPQQFTPGKYTVEINQNGKKITQDFTWGVLAINPNKSIYEPNETANLAIAVLDEKGKMVCDGEVTLNIKSPLGTLATLSTKDKSIIVNPECTQKKYTEKPDFETNYKLGGAGIYQIDLTSTTKNGTYQITDYLQVQNSPEFSVERTTATRIFPASGYPVKLTIKANSDFNGEVTESVPSIFKISELKGTEKYSNIKNANDSQILTWHLDIKKGQTVQLGYYYKPPLVSPEFYLLGPLTFTQNNKEIFKESRQWQIASDDVAVIIRGNKTIVEQATGTSLVMNVPSGLANNDVLIADITNGAAGHSTPPGGWTEFAYVTSSSSITKNAFYHVVTNASTEPSSYTFTVANAKSTGIMVAYRGVDNINPIDVTATTNSNNGNSTYDVTVPSISTVTQRALLISGGGIDASNAVDLAITGGFMQVVQDSTGTGKRGAFADEVTYGAGATGTRTWKEVPSGTTLAMAGYLAALRPQIVSDYYSRVVSTPGLVGYWRLGESAAPFNDSVGTNNLSEGNGAQTSVSGAIFNDNNASLSFNSASFDYLVKSSASGLPTGSGPWTMEAWVKFTTAQSSDANIVAFGAVADNQARAMEINNASLQLDDYSSANYSFGGTLNDGRWHYVAIKYSGSGSSTYYGYIDGQPAPIPYIVAARAPNLGSSVVEIGGFSGYFNGSIDEPAIYNVALTSTQILAHYNAGISNSIVKSPYYDQAIKNTSGILAYWPLDDAGGGFRDATSNGFDATISGTPTFLQTGAFSNNYGSDYSTKFVRNTDYGVVSDNNSFHTGDGPFSVEFWAKTNATGNTEWMFGKWNSGDLGWAVGKCGSTCSVNGSLAFYNKNSGQTSNTWYSSTAPVNDTNWHYYVFTKDAGSAPKLYADGTALTVSNSGGASTTIQSNVYELGISGPGKSVSNDFGGNLEKVAFYNKVLSPGQVKDHYNAGTQKFNQGYFNKIVSQPSLVGYWRLGESSGFPQDSSVNGNNATTGTATQGVAGAIANDSDTANTFNGTTNFWTVPNNTNYNLGDNFTVSLWFKRAGGFGTSQFLLSKGVFASDNTWGVFINASNQVVLETSLTDGSIVNTTKAITDSNWHHVVFTKNGAVSHAYLDGVQNETAGTNATLTNSTAALHIGNETDGSTLFNGSLDEIALFNTALDAGTIKNFYSSGAPLYKNAIIKTPGIVGYWRLDESSGTTAYDSSGGGHNLTYFNSPTLGSAGLLTGDSDAAVIFTPASSNYVQGSDTGFPTGNSAWSIEAWVKTTSSAEIGIAGWGTEAAGNKSAYLALISGIPNFDTASLLNQFGSTAVNDGKPHHVVLTWNGTTMYAYIDGAQTGSGYSPGALSLTLSTADLGHRNTNYFNGTIDEPAIYNVALTPSQIQAHYYVGKTAGVGTSYGGGGFRLNGLIMQ